MESLEYFAGLDLSRDAVGHSRTISPHVTKQVRVPDNGAFTFPLKAQYDKANFTLEGVGGGYSSIVAPESAPLDEGFEEAESVEVTPRGASEVVGLPRVPMPQ